MKFNIHIKLNNELKTISTFLTDLCFKSTDFLLLYLINILDAVQFVVYFYED